MKTTAQKLTNVIGQLEGVKKMLDEDRSCTEILTQLKASKSALTSLTTGFVEENILAQMDKVCAKETEELHILIKKLAE